MMFSTWNYLIFVMALSMCVLTEQCFDFLSVHLLTTDMDQRGIKKCSVSHLVAGQRLILVKKVLFLKKKGAKSYPTPYSILFEAFCIKIKHCIIFTKGGSVGLPGA